MAEAVKLCSLLPEQLDSMAAKIQDQLCRDEQIKGMKLAWDFVADKLHEALKSALDSKVVDILAECWATAEPVARLAQSTCQSPGRPCVIHLGEHKLDRELKPVIAVTIGSCPCIELEFLFALSAQIGGVSLSVVDGYIVGGDLGEAWASAELSYEGVPLHPKAETRRVPIGGAFDLTTPGIAIPGLARTAERVP